MKQPPRPFPTLLKTDYYAADTCIREAAGFTSGGIMRRSVNQLLTGLVCAGVVAATPARPLAAADAKFAPDHALTMALEKGDKATVGTLLDANFQWIDVT